MKLFTDHMTRGTSIALLVHGILLTLIGIWFFALSVEFIKNPRGVKAPAWRLYTAAAGWGSAVGAGAVIAVLTTIRLARLSDNRTPGLPRALKAIFVAEFVVVFIFGGMILDGGEQQRWMLLWTIALNFGLLGVFGRSPKRELDRTMRQSSDVGGGGT
jgi:hypothetical protein